MKHKKPTEQQVLKYSYISLAAVIRSFDLYIECKYTNMPFSCI